MPTKKSAAPVKSASTRKPASTGKRVSTRVTAPARTDVFISYSHPDKAWVEKLTSHLRPLERANLTVWVDTRLRAGDKWRGEIEKALAKTKVAILLVSHHFLASDFIHNNELPPLLSAAASAGTVILPLLVSTSLFERTPLYEFQAVNSPSQPLDLLSEGQVNQVLAQVAQRVDDIFKGVAAPAVPSQPRTSARRAAQTPTASTTAPTVTSNTKKRRTAPPTGQPEASAAGTSLALLVRRNGEWEAVSVRHAVVGKELILKLGPVTAGQTAFLADLRRKQNELASVAFGLQTYRCTLRELNAETEGGKETWQLTATVQELNARTEVTYNGFTPEMQAQARAELLLLDSRSAEVGLARLFGSGNGLDEVVGSPLPALYQQLGHSATRFRQVAPLVASWFLHFTGTVQHILRLKLTLRGTRLTVDFEGRRETPYRDTPSPLRVQGGCELGGPARLPLLLGPVRSY